MGVSNWPDTVKKIQDFLKDTGTSEVITPWPITPTFGYTKETHPHPPYVCGFTTPGRDVPLGDVPRRRLVGGGGRTSILFECCV